VTRLAASHDARFVYVFITALRPADPIPGLAEVEHEDFCCVFQLPGHQRGLYFGLNEKGEHIGLPQIWDDKVLQPSTAADRYPWSRFRRKPGNLYVAKPSPWLTAYDARVIRGRKALTACFKVDRKLLRPGIGADGGIRFTAGRRCYRTSELVSWGGPVVWASRVDAMGCLRLTDRYLPAKQPFVRRLDVVYDCASETGEFQIAWQGPTTSTALKPFAAGPYAGYMGKYTLALNGQEQTGDIAPRTTNRMAVPDGWNRLEVLTGFGPALVVSFQKFSGARVMPSVVRSPGRFASRTELKRLFAIWHAAMERSYQGDGTWGAPGVKIHCLCHDGVFNIEPYLLACRYIEGRAIYRQRIRETCERALAAQHAEGWFPCYCAAAGGTAQPAPFEGGAFTHGSVGEALLMAADVLGEPRYFEAARRAAAAYRLYRWEDNQNYAAFALWHLAELYRHDRSPRTLAHAVHYARHFVARGMDMAGAQDGHNYYTGYSNITLKGLARLLEVLTRSHGYYAELRNVVIRAANQALARQQENGEFAGRNRKYLGYRHSAPGLFCVARALPELAPDLTPALLAMYEAQKHGSDWRHNDTRQYDGLVIACTARFLADRRSR
jgi:hypothetical protein